jgi:hypothetical protein
MSDKAAVVFTAKSVERILHEGGTSAWRLDRKNARHCGYAVCTRNAHADWVEGTEPHHSAFLIGKIRDVVPCTPTPENKESPQNRYLIQFSEFTRVNIADVWKGDRNPVKYATLAELGIDASRLKWEKMPALDASTITPPTTRTGPMPLTMAEAKKGLALTFGVTPEAIEITVRG